MATVRRVRVAVAVTATGGASQAFYTSHIDGGGWIEAIRYNPGAASAPTTANAVSTAAHIAIIGEKSGIAILDATTTGVVTWYPRAQLMSTGGAALGYTSAATPPAQVGRIPVGGERVKFEISSGGAASAVSGGRTATIDLYLAGA